MAHLFDDLATGVFGIGNECFTACHNCFADIREPLQTVYQFRTIQITKTVVGR